MGARARRAGVTAVDAWHSRRCARRWSSSAPPLITRWLGPEPLAADRPLVRRRACRALQPQWPGGSASRASPLGCPRVRQAGRRRLTLRSGGRSRDGARRDPSRQSTESGEVSRARPRDEQVSLDVTTIAGPCGGQGARRAGIDWLEAGTPPPRQGGHAVRALRGSSWDPDRGRIKTWTGRGRAEMMIGRGQRTCRMTGHGTVKEIVKVEHDQGGE